jgi:hypothetical protein
MGGAVIWPEDIFGLDLLQRLHEAVDRNLPVTTSEAQPAWKVFMLPRNPDAPETAFRAMPAFVSRSSLTPARWNKTR